MKIPTIRVGRETIWLDGKALADGFMKLDRESISEQCENCGRDIIESGNVEAHRVGRARAPRYDVRCDCGETYPVEQREVV